MAVVFSARSQADLAENLDFHAERNIVHARSLTDRLIGAAMSLARFPERGAREPGSSARRYRRIIESGHAIVYAVYGEDVVIVRILHGSRDIETILAEEF